MAKTLPNIVYLNDNGNTKVDSDSSEYLLEFYKSPEFFSSPESKTKFLKDCERLVRTNKRYSAYINYLKTKVKLNHCQVLSKLTDEKVSIEMHHGPIFTLYDICEIITDHYIEKGWKISTFRIAKQVLDEHWKNNIQVVMLSTTVHQEVTNREIWLNMQQAWGNLNRFLKKYKLNDDLREKYNRYVDESMMRDSTTYEILKLNEKIFEKGGIE
jgi:hypothetical protein